MDFNNVFVKGIVSAVPKNIINNFGELDQTSESYKLSRAIGISQRRIAPKDIHTSDLCCFAASELTTKIGWDFSSIDILIFVSQTADHLIPATSHIIQDKLGLRKNILCFDVNEGCAGYVYGLSIMGKLLDGKSFKRGLLLVGDTVSKLIAPGDNSNTLLFGDCGTATAVEFDPNEDTSTQVEVYSDGSGRSAIIVEKGTICSRDIESNDPARSYLSLKGTDVFLFAIKEVPKVINEFVNKYGINIDDLDGICLHQANKIINDGIAKKLNLSKEKFLESLECYGNTSSGSIPLSICNNPIPKENKKLLLCGFGIGLSWGVGLFTFKGTQYSIIEV